MLMFKSALCVTQKMFVCLQNYDPKSALRESYITNIQTPVKILFDAAACAA